MSELKVRGVDDVYIEYYNTGKHELAQVYLKSEADKILAEKDKEIAELKTKITKSKELADGIRCDIEKVKDDAAETLALLEERNRQIGNLDAIAKRNQIAAQTLRKKMNHQKRKRCLAMAKWCYSMDCRMLNEASDNGTYFKESWCWKRASWYGKWKHKWLELAERFEEA